MRGISVVKTGSNNKTKNMSEAKRRRLNDEEQGKPMKQMHHFLTESTIVKPFPDPTKCECLLPFHKLKLTGDRQTSKENTSARTKRETE